MRESPVRAGWGVFCMAGERTAAWPSALLHGVLAWVAALPTRHIRITVLLCVIAIGGSFAAAGALQMRFDRVQAFRQAAYFEAKRAHATAAVAQASLARFERFGRLFAADAITDRALAASPEFRGVAIADSAGQTLRASGEAIDMQSLTELARRGRVVLGAPSPACAKLGGVASGQVFRRGGGWHGP